MCDCLLGDVQVVWEGHAHCHRSEEHLYTDDEILVTGSNRAHPNNLDALVRVV